MMACCDLTYGKYILADGTVDETLFWAAVAAAQRARAEMRNAKKRERLKMVADRTGFDPARACKCRCHVVGTTVFH